MIRCPLPLLVFVCLPFLQVRGGEAPQHIGDGVGDQLIFTARRSLKDDYKKQAIDPHRYRLGTDIVVFIGDRSEHRARTLYMCAAEEFSQKELKSFPSSTRRKDLPPRDDPMFANLQVTGRRAGFH